jgi:hypothetical protein
MQWGPALVLTSHISLIFQYIKLGFLTSVFSESNGFIQDTMLNGRLSSKLESSRCVTFLLPCRHYSRSFSGTEWFRPALMAPKRNGCAVTWTFAGSINSQNQGDRVAVSSSVNWRRNGKVAGCRLLADRITGAEHEGTVSCAPPTRSGPQGGGGQFR